MSPRVVVDALAARFGGGLSYLLAQLPALERVAPDLRLEVLADPSTAPLLSAELDGAVRAIAFPRREVRAIWEQTVLPLRSHGAALYCPGNVVPLAAARRSVLVLQNPNYFGAGRRLPHNTTTMRRAEIAMCHASVRRSSQVFAISHALLDAVTRDVPRRAGALDVLPSGAPIWDDPANRPASLPDALLRDGAPPPFVALANDAPHKALDVLVEAWDAARAAGLGHALVIAGTIAPARAATLRAITTAPDLHLIGPLIDRGEVRWLLEHAHALVAPSLLEAHPLTPAEAGALGCPVVLSDIPAHREVAGAHATYVRPGDVPALAQALLAVRGRDSSDPWRCPTTWDDNARRLADALREVAPC